jgi:hypothetical protein
MATNLVEMDLALHRSWRLAVQRYKRIAALPLHRRGRNSTNYDGRIYQARENARFLYRRWRFVRDQRLAAGGAKLKYPKLIGDDDAL